MPGPSGMKELGTMLGLAKSSLTGLVDRTSRLDLVRREPDPRDRRAVRVALAEEGSRVAEDFHAETCRRIDLPADRSAALGARRTRARAAGRSARPGRAGQRGTRRLRRPGLSPARISARDPSTGSPRGIRTRDPRVRASPPPTSPVRRPDTPPPRPCSGSGT
ncbi:MarR family transcriptional regulator [Streptomyces sp. NPDC059352]|uniref:MarR family transcriptional regulator n=1 Tax=Streptomyces sp. NPDC059352 TaxID=3346810 RepID=UPI0036A5CC87